MKKYSPAFCLLSAFIVLGGIASLLADAPVNSTAKVKASPFVDGDRWCVLGDSITHGGSYHKDVELFYLTRYPGKRLEVINCGISGDTAQGALKRLDWDCLTNRPTVVSLMLGMNDVNRSLYSSTVDSTTKEKRVNADANYDANMTNLVSRILASGSRLILITPTPYDDTAADSQSMKFASNLPGCGDALRGYARKVRGWGAESGMPVIDFSEALTALNDLNQKTNASFTIIGNDRVHPGPVGHLVMAHEFLKTQGVDGTVSTMGIDASSGRETCSSNCRISNIRSVSGGVTFSCLENSLPYPLTKEQLPALGLIPFTQDLNRETLRVTGLAPGDYSLSIDGKAIRNYTSAQLDEGVNLALETNTPQMMQAAEVLAAISKKWDAAGKIRTIVFNENYALPDAPRPLTNGVAAISLAYEEKLAASKSTNSYFSKIHEHYADDKSHEEEILSLMAESLSAARKSSLPRMHEFSVMKVSAAQ